MHRSFRASLSAVVCAVLVLCGTVVAGQAQSEALRILETSGVEGGLVVHVGCGDGRLTAALGAGDPYLVHGLDTDPEHVGEARDYLRRRGLYGGASVDRLRGGRLPYIDGVVNLVVCEAPDAVDEAEIMRVLCPGGVGLVHRGGGWEKKVKPRPDALDDWTHYLHGPDNNAVSTDSRVAPPRRLQWVSGPPWSRHHDFMASLNALVSSGGRIFYIIDEGPTESIQLPAEWRLVARDAFNGTLLWKRDIPSWHPHYWLLKSGPSRLPRRLVARGDRVYATLGIDAPLTALDAATGRTVRTYGGTEGTEEFVLADGVLYAVVDEDSSEPFRAADGPVTPAKVRGRAKGAKWETEENKLMAVRAATGEVLWERRDTVVPLTLAAGPGGVFYYDGRSVVRLSREGGEPVWRSPELPSCSPVPVWFAPTLVLHDGVVLFSGGENAKWHRGAQNDVVALSVETGDVLWKADHPPSAYDAPEDLLVAGGLVWTGPLTKGHQSGTLTGRDPATGEVKSEFPADDWPHMPHHRCHRAKATENYLLTSRTGVEFVDLRAEHWIPHHWVRGSCLYGIMPANGLLYAPPHSCACYPEAKLHGFNALAPSSGGRGFSGEARPNRLEKGPAYGEMEAAESAAPDADWPTYRHDLERSGRIASPVPAAAKPLWEAELGGRLTAPVSAGGRAFVAQIDRHTVHALDLRDGSRLWSYTAGGRVDSPPTIYRGRVLFGSADGHVYCLRASDGELAWRYRAASADRRLVSRGQVESVWPVHGSVLVRDGQVYCVAGRSMFLDGGMRLLRLDAATGEKLSETVLDRRNPQTGKNLQHELRWPSLPPALPDVLSCDGDYVYMRSQRFDLSGRRPEVEAARDYAGQQGEGAHLFCPTGFLDDAWWHRSYWLFGRNFLGGAGGWWAAAHFAPAGRPLVMDDSRVYGFARKPEHWPQTTTMEYHLFATSRRPEIVCSRGKPPAGIPKSRRWGVPPHNQRAGIRSSHPRFDWTGAVPFHARALVLAGDTLFVAGPPDLVDDSSVYNNRLDEKTRRLLRRQVEALRGAEGMTLWAVSASDGRKLAERGLESAPVWDGMAAARGRLLLSTKDGSLLCLGGAK